MVNIWLTSRQIAKQLRTELRTASGASLEPYQLDGYGRVDASMATRRNGARALIASPVDLEEGWTERVLAKVKAGLPAGYDAFAIEATHAAIGERWYGTSGLGIVPAGKPAIVIVLTAAARR